MKKVMVVESALRDALWLVAGGIVGASPGSGTDMGHGVVSLAPTLDERGR